MRVTKFGGVILLLVLVGLVVAVALAIALGLVLSVVNKVYHYGYSNRRQVPRPNDSGTVHLVTTTSSGVLSSSSAKRPSAVPWR